MKFPHTALIKRQTQQGGKYLYGPAGSTVCFLQPIDTQSSEAYGITFSKGSVCYLPLNANVQESDRLEINGVSYGVAGVREHNYGSLGHKKAALERL